MNGGTINETHNFAYSEGFLQEWLKSQPKQVGEHLQILLDGIRFYKDKYETANQDLESTRKLYTELTAQSAMYLQLIQQQREMLDQHLVEQQREFHQKTPLIET
jgi:hypothetical protein